MTHKFHEFTTSTDIYKDYEGKEILIKKGLSAKATLNLKDIDFIGEAFKNDGSLFKTKCLVHHIEMGKLLLSHKYKEVKKIKEDYLKENLRIKVKGFIK